MYEIYKPLRNQLKKCGVADSLSVIRSYIQNLQFDENLPADIEVDREYRRRDRIQKTSWISEWNLEILAKEVIISSSELSRNEKSFRKWKFFASTINKLKALDSHIAESFVNRSNIFTELGRIAHSQFAWQIGRPSSRLVARYYRIYKSSGMSDILKKAIGLTAKELYFVGYVISAHFFYNFDLQIPFKTDVKKLDQEAVNRFLKSFSSDLPTLREKLRSEQNMSEKFFYEFSSLRRFPIIRIDYEGKERLVCPIPTLLFWRITIGLYYEVLNKKNFDNEFGSSFQAYIGDCIITANKNEKMNVFPEESFPDGKNRKDSVDWIVDDGISAIFIECKAKRMTMPSKTELISMEARENDIEIMANGIVQLYKTIRDYRNDKYKTFKFNEQKSIYPLIVTLESWHLFGNNASLKTKIEEKLKINGIPLDWLRKMPYTVCSTQEFEDMIQIIQMKGIGPVIGKKLDDQEKIQWEMDSFLRNEYPEEIKKLEALFGQDFYSLMPDEIMKK